jgi:dCTP diphosphatase
MGTMAGEPADSEPGSGSNPGPGSELTRLRDLVRVFVDERDWDQFHTPKNLASALCVEAAELLEPFQWLQTGRRDELGDAKLGQVRHEMADVLVYLIRLADKLDVDLGAAVLEKMALNGSKYPADKVRGDARKYSDYPHDP